MTLDEIRASGKEMLTPGDISGVLNADPQTIRMSARAHPDKIGFPVVVIGNRVKIPRAPFLALFDPKER